SNSQLRYGPKYIIPAPFDPRLITRVPPAVAQAAMDTGVARKPIVDMTAYRHVLRARLDPTALTLQLMLDQVRNNPKRVVFAEGEEERVIRAAQGYRGAGYGSTILVGRNEPVREAMQRIGLEASEDLQIHNAAQS